MSYPSIDNVAENAVLGTGEATSQLFKLVSECMYQIWEGEEVHECSDYSTKDKLDFLDSLSHEQFEKIQEFFETMPKLRHEVTVTNPNTKVTSTVVLQGVQSFLE